MDENDEMDYSSVSETECGLEQMYYSAREEEDEISALETVVAMDVDRTKPGFKALKRMVKLLMRENYQQALDNYTRLFNYIGSPAVTTNEADKALDSLWSRFCTTVTGAEAKRRFCLTTLTNLHGFPSRLTRLKWLIRLVQQCPHEEYPQELYTSVDEYQQLAEDVHAMEGVSDSVKRNLFDAFTVTTLIYVRQKQLGHAYSNLNRLRELAGENSPVNVARIKEIRALVTLAGGKYGESFNLLLASKKLYDEVGNDRSQLLCIQLRLLALLLPNIDFDKSVSPVWTEPCALAEELVRLFKEEDVAGMRSTLYDVQARIGHFAGAELGCALLRNRTSRRMPPESWLDIFAYLSRWELDAPLFTARRLSSLISAKANVLPLRVVAEICLIGHIPLVLSLSNVADYTITEFFRPVDKRFFGSEFWTPYEAVGNYKIWMSAWNGLSTVQNERDFAALWDDFSASTSTDFVPANTSQRVLGYLQAVLANVVVEKFDIIGSIPFGTSPFKGEVTSATRIKRLNQIYSTYTPRLPTLRWLGDVHIGEFTTKFSTFADSSLLEYCFDERNKELLRRLVVCDRCVHDDFAVQFFEKARESSWQCGVYLEVQTRREALARANAGLLGGYRKETFENTTIFHYEWEASRLRVELGPTWMVARYSRK
ncbi:COP9 signalosome complex subunit 2-like protein [Aphelenchoides avenae]|nr:COP9 signalosome complex subunit 2-like protein [Aphelenchus avenae]